MKIFETTETTGHEQILFCHDQASGLRSIIAIHDTSPGFAMGATRLWPYATEAAALTDVLRLSRGMTYKAACANIPVGGGKAVIIARPEQKTNELLRAYGRFIDSINGQFVTGQDVNLNAQDVRQICIETKHVVGTQERNGGPVAATATGVLLGIQAAVEFQRQQRDLRGLKIAIQGLGNIGGALCEELHERGAKLFVTDINPERVEAIAQKYNATPVAPEDIYAVDADIFCPCALGAILNAQTIPQLKATIIAGSANNQLAHEQQDGELLSERGILYCPDYVINAGGLINVYHEMVGYEELKVFKHVQGIGNTLTEIFEQADKSQTTTNISAYCLADSRIAAAKAKKIKVLQSV